MSKVTELVRMSSIFIQLFLLAHVTWGQKLVPWLTHTHTPAFSLGAGMGTPCWSICVMYVCPRGCSVPVGDFEIGRAHV